MDGAPQPFESSWQECVDLLNSLPSMEEGDRVEAIGRLIRNPSPGIRNRALRMGAASLPDDRIKDYLRSDADDVLRNAGVEMLKMRGNRGFGLTLQLLKDEDPDVVLQAVIVLTHLRDPRGLEPLRSSLHHPDPNIVQEAIVAIGTLGDARAIPDLLGFLDSDSWLQMAAVQALGNLRSPVAVPHLRRLLTDFMAGPMAAEALARIGGTNAFKALAAHWLRFRKEIDSETTLGLLAHVLEGLSRAPAPVEGLRENLDELLEDEAPAVRESAARCLLCLGPGEEDERALAEVAASHCEASVLPACLHHRKDLIGSLVAEQGVLRTWGFLLAGRFPKSTPVEAVVRALDQPAQPDQFEPMIRTLEKIRAPEIGAALLGFYLRLPEEQRTALHPLLAIHAQALTDAVDRQEDLDPATAIVIHALLGADPIRIRDRLDRLEPRDRVRAVSELLEHQEIVRILPWAEWLREEPEELGPVAAEFASRFGIRELAPVFRDQLEQRPEPYLVRTLGELGDRESVGQLTALLEDPRTPLEALVLESIGRIGGPESRRALRACVDQSSGQRERMAYRALSRCATDEDDEIFRRAASHSDWYIRLSCAEVLGRFSRPENLAALAKLAADPVPIVAQRALSFLET